MTCVKTTCPYCGVGCGVLAKAGEPVKGDVDHPANFGRLCSKGSALGETLDHEGRLLAPQIGDRSASWDEALDLVADKFRAAVDEHGPDSVAFYVSGQLLTEDYYVANKLMKGYIGSANIDTNSRLCMASSVAGHKRAFGTDTVPGTYEDLEEADLLVLVGSNLAWCHPVLFQRVAAAKAARPNMRVINIDPRVTSSSDLADLHLAIKGDGDVALFNGLLAEIAARGAVNTDYVEAHVNGFDAAVACAAASDASASGLTDAELKEFYDMWIGTEKVVTIYSQGVNQSESGADKVNAILNCHLATGRIGREGMGPFSVTGQPNAMGGREVGGLANMLACHLDIENADHRDAVQSAWNSPTMCTTAGLKAVDLFDACARGDIKALWVMSTNPAVSMPHADSVVDAIKNVPFVAVSDIMARTDTGDLADVLLPAAGWGEKSGTVTNSERRMSRQRPFLPAPEGTMADWKIMCEVAKRMGWSDAFDYTGEADVFREYAALSALGTTFQRDFDISGLKDISDQDYDAMAPVQWPVKPNAETGGRFFANGGFYHADGKAKMLAVSAPELAAIPDDMFRLNTGRIRDQWHTMSRTGKSARLSQHLAEPYVEIHPEDALSLGVHAADLVRLTSEQGTSILRVLVSKKVQLGTVFAPMHWTGQLTSSGRVNPLVAPKTDPVSGQPALKATNVSIERMDAGWYGFAVSMNQMKPTRPYAAIARTNTGSQAEIAGYKIPADWEVEARSVTGITGGEVSMMNDPASGAARVAITENGVITALFYAASTPVAVARQHIVGLVGTDISAGIALAGRASADMPDPGATVCSCLNVGVNTLRTAIVGGANSVDKLGECTGAGTNCGSCKPELAALLAELKTPVAAE